MGAKIQADEISSIIKERIDNFELERDRKMLVIGCTPEPLGLKAAVAAAIGNCIPINYVSKEKLELVEQSMFHENLIYKKENHPYGWYRKFEKKRF